MLVRIAVMVGGGRLMIMRPTAIGMAVMPATAGEAVQQHRKRCQDVDGGDHSGPEGVGGCWLRPDFRGTESFSQDGPRAGD